MLQQAWVDIKTKRKGFSKPLLVISNQQFVEIAVLPTTLNPKPYEAISKLVDADTHKPNLPEQVLFYLIDTRKKVLADMWESHHKAPDILWTPDGRNSAQNLYTDSRYRHKFIPLALYDAVSDPLVELLALNSSGDLRLASQNLLRHIIDAEPQAFLKKFFQQFLENQDHAQEIHSTRSVILFLRALVTGLYIVHPIFTSHIFNFFTSWIRHTFKEKRRVGEIVSSSTDLTLESEISLLSLNLSVLNDIIQLFTLLVPSCEGLTTKELKRNKLEGFFFTTTKNWAKHLLKSSEAQPNTMHKDFHEAHMSDLLQKVHLSQTEFMAAFAWRAPSEVPALIRIIFGESPTTTSSKSRPLSANVRAFVVPWTSGVLDNNRDEISRSFETLVDFDFYFFRTPHSIISFPFTVEQHHHAWTRLTLSILHQCELSTLTPEVLDCIFAALNIVVSRFHHNNRLVAKCLASYLTLMTRFARALRSGELYTKFIPAIFNLHYIAASEAKTDLMQAVIMLWVKFFSIHSEAFVLNSISVLVPIFLSAEQKGPEAVEQFAFSLLDCYQSIAKPSVLSGRDYDPLDVRAFLPGSHGLSGDSKSDFQISPCSSFDVSDLIRVITTVVAFEPISMRAAEYLKALKILIKPILNRIEMNLIPTGTRSGTLSMLHLSVWSIVGIYHNLALGRKRPAASRSFGLHSAAIPKPTDEIEDEVLRPRWFVAVCVREMFSLVRELVVQTAKAPIPSEVTHLINISSASVRDMAIQRISIRTDWFLDLTAIVLTLVDTEFFDEVASVYVESIGQVFTTYSSVGDFTNMILAVERLLVGGRTSRKLANSRLPKAVTNSIIYVGICRSLEIGLTEDPILRHAGYHMKFSHAMVKLIAAWILHTDSDIFATLDKVSHDPEYLAYILYPLLSELAPPPLSKTSGSSTWRGPSSQFKDISESNDRSYRFETCSCMSKIAIDVLSNHICMYAKLTKDENRLATFFSFFPESIAPPYNFAKLSTCLVSCGNLWMALILIKSICSNDVHTQGSKKPSSWWKQLAESLKILLDCLPMRPELADFARVDLEGGSWEGGYTKVRDMIRCSGVLMLWNFIYFIVAFDNELLVHMRSWILDKITEYDLSAPLILSTTLERKRNSRMIFGSVTTQSETEGYRARKHQAFEFVKVLNPVEIGSEAKDLVGEIQKWLMSMRRNSNISSNIIIQVDPSVKDEPVTAVMAPDRNTNTDFKQGAKAVLDAEWKRILDLLPNVYWFKQVAGNANSTYTV